MTIFLLVINATHAISSMFFWCPEKFKYSSFGKKQESTSGNLGGRLEHDDLIAAPHRSTKPISADSGFGKSSFFKEKNPNP